MNMLPGLPNIRYVRVRDADGNDLNLFRLDGSDEDVAHAIDHMRAAFEQTEHTVTIDFMDRKDAIHIEWGFIMNNCVPWEEAKKYLKNFDVVISWN